MQQKPPTKRMTQKMQQTIIYEYVDFLKRHNKTKQALELLKSKIESVESSNVAEVLQQKYDELKAETDISIGEKIKNFFNKKSDK